MDPQPTTPDEAHGLTVENIPRERCAQPRLEAGDEPCHDGGLTTDLHDLADTPLNTIAQAARDGDTAIDQTLQRIAPQDGSRVLLVSAAFNSAI